MKFSCSQKSDESGDLARTLPMSTILCMRSRGPRLHTATTILGNFQATLPAMVVSNELPANFQATHKQLVAYNTCTLTLKWWLSFLFAISSVLLVTTPRKRRGNHQNRVVWTGKCIQN